MIGLGGRVAGPVANWLVPFLAASRFGWRSVAYLWGVSSGVFAVVWHLLAADAPAPELSEEGERAAISTNDAPKSAVRWDIFKLPAALCVPWCHICDNNAMYSLAMLAPTVYTVRLGIAPQHLGPHLAIPPTLNVFGVCVRAPAALFRLPLISSYSYTTDYPWWRAGAFAIAALENALSARRISLVKVQKLFTGLGALTEFVFLTMFALARRCASLSLSLSVSRALRFSLSLTVCPRVR